MSATTPSARFGLVAVTASALLLGTTGTAADLGPDAIGSQTAGAWRTLIGGVALLLVTAVTGRAVWRYRLTGWAAFGAASLAANQLTFFAAMERTGVAIGALVTLATVPVTAGLIDWVASGERPSNRWALGTAVAIVGVGCLTGSGAEVDVGGVLLAVAAGATAAGIGLAVQRLVEDRPSITAMATIVAGGAILLLPVALSGAGDVASAAGAATVGYLGIVNMATAFSLWAVGLEHLSLSTVSAVGLLEPAVASLLAVTVLDEPAGLGLVVGVVLVLVGVGVVSSAPAPPVEEILHATAGADLDGNHGADPAAAASTVATTPRAGGVHEAGAR